MSPDFQRDVHCVLGLPFDAVDLDAAVGVLRGAVNERRRCFLSTPNLNFAVAALRDAAFRDSVLHSDLSVADGMPLIWVARLLGVPLPERVAGSTLFERLGAAAGASMRVFFFGGPPGVAALACERLNAGSPALRCVGFESPGFGSLESMSTPQCLARINASGADFVVVSLGARKGQAWIERNGPALEAPLLSHLGAVVNFVAGTVTRSPRWMQRAGLEWLWRIKEEPGLWRRYARDGAAFAHLLSSRIVPGAIRRWRRPRHGTSGESRLEVVPDGLRLHGSWRHENLAPLRAALDDLARRTVPARIDLGAVTDLDAAAVALLVLWWAHGLRSGVAASVGPAAPAARRALRYCCADYVLEPTDGAGTALAVPAR